MPSVNPNDNQMKTESVVAEQLNGNGVRTVTGQPEREISQTDRINKNLLSNFLKRLNEGNVEQQFLENEANNEPEQQDFEL